MAEASTAHSEWLTRKRLIDQKVKAAGWRVMPYEEWKPLSEYDRCAIEEYPTDTGPVEGALRLGCIFNHISFNFIFLGVGVVSKHHPISIVNVG